MKVIYEYILSVNIEKNKKKKLFTTIQKNEKRNCQLKMVNKKEKLKKRRRNRRSDNITKHNKRQNSQKQR